MNPGDETPHANPRHPKAIAHATQLGVVPETVVRVLASAAGLVHADEDRGGTEPAGPFDHLHKVRSERWERHAGQTTVCLPPVRVVVAELDHDRCRPNRLDLVREPLEP